MKQFILKSFFLGLIIILSFRSEKSYFKYNTCDFSEYKMKMDVRYGVSIVEYKIVNFRATENCQLSEYYLIKSESDTFNLITTINGSTSDTTVKKFRHSNNWVFLPMKDSCFEFYSLFDLKKTINYNYPVIFGQIGQGLD